MRKVTLITGGERSGKSQLAERLALALAPDPVYVATAHVWDQEFAHRVRRHQERRGSQWTNVEEEKHLSRLDVRGRVVLVDCLTLWATNWLPTDALPHVDDLLQQLTAELDAFTRQDATFIFVTNEIGSGGVSPNALQRRFTDLMGWLNQHVAAMADDVVHVVCGVPIYIKRDGRELTPVFAQQD